MKTIFSTYALLAFLSQVYIFMRLTSQNDPYDSTLLLMLPVFALAFISLFITFIIDLRRNKGVTRRIRYFKKLLLVHVPIVIISLALIRILAALGMDDLYRYRPQSFMFIFEIVASFILFVPITGYVIGALCDLFSKKAPETPSI